MKFACAVPLRILLTTLALSLLAGCAAIPQRRVLISSHPSDDNPAVTLASFPAELRALMVIQTFTPEDQKSLKAMAEEIHKLDTQGDPAHKRSALVDDFNRMARVAAKSVIIPEVPARVVVSMSKLAPKLAASPNGTDKVELSLEALQAVTKLGEMPANELKAYLAYLTVVQAHNQGTCDSGLTSFFKGLAESK